MPASLILFACATIGIAVWTTLRHYARKVKSSDPAGYFQRLHQHAAWLELRLDTARQERWDRKKILSLSDQLGATCEELARVKGGSFRNTTASVQ
jgi:alkylation response protein AidB-like acyl-CoA dehydrogenase